MSSPIQPRSVSLRTALVVLLSFVTVAAGSPAPAVAVSTPVVPGGFTPLTPFRLLDTRTGLGLSPATRSAVGPAEAVILQVAGRGGVPSSNVDSVLLNVTVTSPTARGHVTAYANGTTRPATSSVSFAAAQTVPGLVLARVGANGKVSLANVSAGTLHLVADVSGYYRSGTATAAGSFVSLRPLKVLDTESGVGTPKAAVSARTSVSLLVAGAGGVPVSGVSAVALNVTAAGPTRAGYLTAYASGATRPAASNLNFAAGRTSSNLVVIPVGSGGRVVLYNGSTGAVALSASVLGYFLAGAPTASGTFRVLASARLMDTRTRPGVALVANPKVATVIRAARSILGIRYSYGGGTAAGPTRGIAQGANTVGFDCSSSVQYEYAKAGVRLARVTSGQEKQGTAVLATGPTGLAGALAGDLLFWGTPGATYHVGLYIGSGQMIEAQKTGTVIHVIKVWGKPSVIRRVFPAVTAVTAAVAVAPGATVHLMVAGRAGVAPSGVAAGLLNITVVSPTQGGFVTVYGSGRSRPAVSNLNFGSGQTVANLVASPVGADGSVLLYNGSTGTVHLVADVYGYYRA